MVGSAMCTGASFEYSLEPQPYRTLAVRALLGIGHLRRRDSASIGKADLLAIEELPAPHSGRGLPCPCYESSAIHRCIGCWNLALLCVHPFGMILYGCRAKVQKKELRVSGIEGTDSPISPGFS